MNTFLPMDLEAIANLDKTPDKPKRNSSKIDTSVRTYEVWWKLPQFFGNCDNPNCIDPRPRKIETGHAMLAVVDKLKMCRFCFLDGFGKDENS